MRIDWTYFESMVNPVYKPLYNDMNRFIIKYGGAGSGKSVDTALRVVSDVVLNQASNWMVVRKVARTQRSSCFALIKQAINMLGFEKLFEINKSEMLITCKLTKSQILFVGLDDVEKLKSITFEYGILSKIWFEEATEGTEYDITQLNLRLRGLVRGVKPQFQFIMTFNPVDEAHYIKNKFFNNSVKNCTILHTTFKDNKFIDDEYAAELEALKLIDPIAYDVYALGKWGKMGDIVFKNARFEHVPYSYEDFDHVYAGMDFGYTHHHANELIGFKDGTMYSFSELYVKGMHDSDIVPINEEQKILPKTQMCCADSADPKGISVWRSLGYRLKEAKKGPDSVRAQLSFLASTPWVIDPDKCPGLAAEVKGFAYRKNNKTGEPFEIDEAHGFHDDAIAACRYAIEELTKKRIKYGVY